LFPNEMHEVFARNCAQSDDEEWVSCREDLRHLEQTMLEIVNAF